MNIWFFNHYAVPPEFYPLARPYNFAKCLIKRGYTVNIFAASTVHNSNLNLIDEKEKYRNELLDGIKYTYLKTCNYNGNSIARIINMLQYTLGLVKVNKHFDRPDIIIATSVHPLTCIAGIRIAKKRKCKCIVEIADMWPLTLIEFGILREQGLISNILYRLERWIYKNADSIVFTMEGGKDYIIEKGWDNEVNTSKVFYINNGIDIDLYNRRKVNELFKDDDLDDKSYYKVIYAGTLGEANALDYLVESANIIQNKGYYNIKFIIFGSGYKKTELEDYCRNNCLSNVVFKGKVEKKYIPNILSKSNLNIFTGKHIYLYKYGLSLNKMFEYLASGKPTLSNIECGYDMLKQYKCGITVKGGSAEALAEGILKFYNMPKEEYETYCENALKAAQDFDFKVLTDKLEKVLLED